jgi:hypothetical protein
MKGMGDEDQNGTRARVFTEAEYRADAKSVVAHAVATVVRSWLAPMARRAS